MAPVKSVFFQYVGELSMLFILGERVLKNVHLNEGNPEDDYEVEILVQIFDIFEDYDNCTLKKIYVRTFFTFYSM